MDFNNLKEIQLEINRLHSQIINSMKLIGIPRIYIDNYVKITSWYRSKKVKRIDYHYNRGKKRKLLMKWVI